MKALVLAGSAFALLAFAGAWILTGDGGPTLSLRGEAPAAAPPHARPEPAAAQAPRTASAPTPPAPATAAERAGSDPFPLDPVGRRRALEPLRREVLAGLAELAGRTARCDLAGATVTVTLETLDRAVRVVDARVERLPDPDVHADPAAAPEEVQHCVRSGLAGNVVSAPSARPGRRWEMPFDARLAAADR